MAQLQEQVAVLTKQLQRLLDAEMGRQSQATSNVSVPVLSVGPFNKITTFSEAGAISCIFDGSFPGSDVNVFIKSGGAGGGSADGDYDKGGMGGGTSVSRLRNGTRADLLQCEGGHGGSVGGSTKAHGFAHGAGIGPSVLVGRGSPGGIPGIQGNAAATNWWRSGQPGGNGGYAAGYFSFAPNDILTAIIGEGSSTGSLKGSAHGIAGVDGFVTIHHHDASGLLSVLV